MKDEALELAEMLDGYNADGFPVLVVEQSANMLRRLVDRIAEMEKYVGFKDSGYDIIQLPQTKIFTDDEIKEIIGSYGNEGGIGGYTRQLFDKIEAKIREKNENNRG